MWKLWRLVSPPLIFININILRVVTKNILLNNFMDPPQNSRKQIGEMREVPYWGPTNSRCHCTRFVLHGELVHGICTLLLQPNAFPFKQMSYTYSSRNYCKLTILFLILNSEAKEQLTKYIDNLWQGAIFFPFTFLGPHTCSALCAVLSGESKATLTKLKVWIEHFKYVGGKVCGLNSYFDYAVRIRVYLICILFSVSVWWV